MSLIIESEFREGKGVLAYDGYWKIYSFIEFWLPEYVTTFFGNSFSFIERFNELGFLYWWLFT